MKEILSELQIEQKINRLAHQLLENCFEQKEIYIGGIQGNGYSLAQRLAEIIGENSDLVMHVFEIQINKDEPWSEPITLSLDKEKLKNGFIVLVDDVVNSGKTMQFALLSLLQFPTRAIKTVALVDRKHRRYPIRADFVGLSLSTTLGDRVEIQFTEKGSNAVLV